MKLNAAVGHDNYDIELKRDGDKLTARIDDRTYELEASEPEPNVFLLKHEGRIFEVFVSPQKTKDAPFAVRVGTTEMEVSLTDPKRLRGAGSDVEHGAGKAEIKTAMPGKVVRILVAVGDTVEKGDGIIVVEAMKMQNEMRSPKDGTVAHIKVAENDTVSAGDVLVVIE